MFKITAETVPKNKERCVLCLLRLGEPLYLGGFKQQISIPSSDLEGVAVRYAVRANLAIGEGLQGLRFPLLIQRHGCSSYTQPQLLGKTPC